MLQAIESAYRTDTGRQRRGNEDSLFSAPPVFAVADGMGGAQAGEVASRIAIEAFQQGLPGTGGAEERLAEIAREANREIYERSHLGDDYAGMGTTLTAALLEDDHVAIAHVGDSRAYMYREPELVRLTRDHSLVDELVQRGKLTEEEALEHPQRSIITRALGPEPEVEVDTWTYPVQPGDVLLLCSDGLTSMIGESEIAGILQSEPSLDAAASRMIDAANEAGGRDNITVILFRVGERAALGAEHAEQATVVGQAPVLAGAAASAPPVAPPVIEGRWARRRARTASSAPAQTRTRAPLARTQGHGGGTTPRELTLGARIAIGLISVSIILFLFGGGGYLASRQLYFVGTNAQGTVTVYRGFPYVLPFGVPMYETFYVSGVPASTLPADRRATLLDHNLRSQSAATKLINQLELGQVSG